MIQGIKIKKLKVNKDDRGDFREILKNNEGIMQDIKQISIGKTKPGIIKAFHWHKNQDDIFYLLKGKLLVVLYDNRENSKTFKTTQEIILEETDPQIIFIPRGVFHGYRVLGSESAEVLYIMNNTYDPAKPDEQRVEPNDPSINFNWNKYDK
jgi:dTDP-4-dehydrorhamnose 3,5-epimerase